MPKRPSSSLFDNEAQESQVVYEVDSDSEQEEENLSSSSSNSHIQNLSQWIALNSGTESHGDDEDDEDEEEDDERDESDEDDDYDSSEPNSDDEGFEVPDNYIEYNTDVEESQQQEHNEFKKRKRNVVIDSDEEN